MVLVTKYQAQMELRWTKTSWWFFGSETMEDFEATVLSHGDHGIGKTEKQLKDNWMANEN